MSKKNQTLQKPFLLLHIWLACLFIPHIGLADNNGNPPITTLPTISVIAQPIKNLSTIEIIDRETLKLLPTTNGNLTEALKTIPGVEFSEDFENSKTGGEIRPPEISISGGRPVDNNFIIDGTSNNSLLDPAFSDYDNIDNVQGHSQELFLSDSLIKNISVLRANIPARYGGFTGGVILADTIDPTEEFGGQISWRMTNSAWGKFHLDPEDQELFENSSSADNQPHFTKYQFSTTLNVPVSETSGLLFNYTKLHSDITLLNLADDKNQSRKNENILLKYVYTPHSSTKLRLSAMYAPYEGDYYLKNTVNSNYSLTGGGYKINGQLNHQTSVGELQFNLSFQQSENSRSAPNNYWIWRISPSKNWGELVDSTFSYEGYYGDIDKQQRSITSHLDFLTTPLKTGTITHKINSGVEISKTQATFDRTESMTRYIASKVNVNVICIENSLDCINGEQFSYYKNYYPEDSAKADITNYSIYIDDTLEEKKLTLRPGLRATYNDYQKNTDLAPRLSASYDFFNNSRTILKSGYNRYYGANLLTLKLEEQKTPYEVYLRSTVLIDDYPAPWPVEQKARSSINSSRIGSLKTPYVDEWDIGLDQSVLGGPFSVIYIKRKFQDQIRAVTVDEGVVNYKEWRNTGRKDYEELSLSWQKSWSRQELYLNITWQSSHSNSNSYTDFYDEEQLDLVGYNGAMISRADLPTDNYNRSTKASVFYTLKMPYGFSFSNVLNFRGRYKVLMNTHSKTTLAEGYELEGYEIYDFVRNPSTLTLDWKIAWLRPTWAKTNNMKFTLDILNIFDKKNHHSPDNGDYISLKGDYLIGRQFWAGLEYNF